MKTYSSIGSDRPPSWDTESSMAVVYHNRDVTEKEATDRSPLMYKYTVDEYTKEEYKNDIEPQLAQAALILLGEA